MELNNDQVAKLFAFQAEQARIMAAMSDFIAECFGLQGGRAVRAIPPREGTQSERVLGYIEQRPEGCTRAELRAVFPDMNNNCISGAIARLRDRGQIEVPRRAFYRIPRGQS
jgi:hypothetical protein